jgi:hypothetical protein
VPCTDFEGKTSAIQFLRDYLVRGARKQDQRAATNVKCATNLSGSVEFEVEFDVPGFDERFRYTLVLDEQDGSLPPRRESLECGSRTVFRQSRNQKTDAKARRGGE